MCGRFTLTTTDLAALARRWAAEVEEAVIATWRPRYNVAPGDAHVVLRAADGRRHLVRAAFGLPGRGAGRLVNARAETAAVKPSFRDAYRLRRCAVPADGFIEWSGPASARRPSWLRRADGAPLLFAALWSEAPGGGLAFAILTTDANAEVRALHDRMPLLVPESLLDAWLGDGPAPALPSPADGILSIRPISQRVNSPKNDDPACLEPPPAEPQLALKLG